MHICEIKLFYKKYFFNFSDAGHGRGGDGLRGGGQVPGSSLQGPSRQEGVNVIKLFHYVLKANAK
jgi:hypothetical protein